MLALGHAQYRRLESFLSRRDPAYVRDTALHELDAFESLAGGVSFVSIAMRCYQFLKDRYGAALGTVIELLCADSVICGPYIPGWVSPEYEIPTVNIRSPDMLLAFVINASKSESGSRGIVVGTLGARRRTMT